MGERTWREVEPGSTLLIPLGSTEQHGPHLPLDTDARIAGTIARRAAADTGAVVAPVLPYGASGEHAGFAGTLSLGVEVLQAVLVEVVRSAALSFERIIFVNGHGGNHEAVTVAVRQLRNEGHNLLSWSPVIAGGDAHAGRTETSLMLAIAPELVRLELAEAGNTEPLADLIDRLRSDGLADVSANGVLGDPEGASEAEGQGLLDSLVAGLVAKMTVG